MGSVRVAMAPADAIPEIAWHLSYTGEGVLPIYVDGEPTAHRQLRCTTDALARLAPLAAELDLERSVEVAIGLPQQRSLVYRSTVLWAWVSGSKQLDAAKRFKPVPSIVLRIGASASERLLLWALRKPVSDVEAERLNRRISYCLGAPYTRSKPDALRVPLPGTFARVGRTTPAPILLTRMKVDVGHTAQSVAGRLKEPPPKDAWRERTRR